MARRLTEEEKLLRLITEKTFQKWVEAVLSEEGWLWYHAPDNVPRNGHIQNIKAGFPDLVAVRGRRIIYIELKRETGTTTEAQEWWHAALREAGQEVYVWRPRDKGTIRKYLS